MPYFHATYAQHIPSILKHGLGGATPERNFEGTEPGVYLGSLPELCVMMLLEHLLEDGNEKSSIPAVAMEQIRIIVVDDSRVQMGLLDGDPQVPPKWRDRLFRYRGTIDVRGMPILALDQMQPPEVED